MKKLFLISLTFLIYHFQIIAQESEVVQKSEKELLLEARIPKWVVPILNKAHFFDVYFITDTINPFYLESDFNGDNVDDIALFIVNKQNKKSGIVIINGKTNIHYILGAGKEFGMGDSMNWVQVWTICREKSVASFKDGKKEMNFKYPAIKIVRNESIATYFYWSGNKYKTYNQAL
ncbi:MAG: hypothetical protein HYR91_02655 [Flavobacteriia bacterium]|nr:hypothetical protein [Flavobacteriia bacterium]